MLVLTRKTDQAILIGDPNGSAPPIEISVMDIGLTDMKWYQGIMGA